MKQIEQILKKIFLNFLLLFSFKNNNSNGFGSHSRILVIRLNRIGDALVTTPLLHIIKKNLNCHISVLADKKNHFIFDNNPNVDDVIVFNKGLGEFFSVRKYIKQNNIDTIIDAHDDISTTVSFIIALSNAPNRIALRKANHKLYSKTIVSPDARNVHIIDRLKKISELLNVKIKAFDKGIELFPDKESISIADEWISKVNPDNKFLIGINISAGSEARFWGFENFQRLITLLAKYDVTTIIFAMKDYMDIANKLAGSTNVFPIEFGFDATTAAVLKLNLLFSPDTALIHIASINRIPVFGIYVHYNTTDMIWSPYNTTFDCVITDEPTLNNVYFESVKDKFVPFLDKHIK